MELTLIILAIAGGYVASIFTWPAIRTAMTGAQSEVAKLEARATALKAALKSGL